MLHRQFSRLSSQLVGVPYGDTQKVSRLLVQHCRNNLFKLPEYFQLPDPDYNGKDLALVWLPKSYGMDYQDLPDTGLHLRGRHYWKTSEAHFAVTQGRNLNSR